MLNRLWSRLIRLLLVSALGYSAVFALANLTVFTSWGALPPTSAANQRTVNFGPNTLAGEGARLTVSQSVADCDRIAVPVPGVGIIGYVLGVPIYGPVINWTYPCALGSWGGNVNYAGGSGLSGFSGAALVMDSGVNSGATSVTIQFAHTTPYVGFLWGAQFNAENTQFIALTLENGSVVTLRNCRNSGDAQCVGRYVSIGWLQDVYNILLGWLFGDAITYFPVYVKYEPSNGVTVVVLCVGCTILQTS